MLCAEIRSAQRAMEVNERTFSEIIFDIVKKRAEVEELIKAQERAEVSRAEELLRRMEQEIADLKKRDAELECLSHTQDHIHFLKNTLSVRDSPHSKDLPSMTFHQRFSFKAVKQSVSTLKVKLEEKLQDIYQQEIAKISASVTTIQIVQSLEYTDPGPSGRVTGSYLLLPTTINRAVFPEPMTRDVLLWYSCDFTLDPNTAHKRLILSKDNRKVTYRNEAQSYPDHPERFCERHQVLCKEGLSGRCYWEVEWSGELVYIVVSYKCIGRKCWTDSLFGNDDQSWRLRLSSSSSSFWHNGKKTKLPLVVSSRIGVYVDHRAGILAFYSLSGSMTLLHKVQTTFTQTLYPGFQVGIEMSSSSTSLTLL